MKTETKNRIIAYIKKHNQARVHEIVQFLGISNVAVHKQLRRLVESGVLNKTGKPPLVFYNLPSKLQPDNLVASNKRDRQSNVKKIKNWSTDITELKKDPEAYAIWKLQQRINYGLDGVKLSRSELFKYWDRLEIEPDSKKYLSFLLWPSQASQPS